MTKDDKFDIHFHGHEIILSDLPEGKGVVANIKIQTNADEYRHMRITSPSQSFLNLMLNPTLRSMMGLRK